MKPNELKTLFDYNFWAFERVWESISQLTDEQFIEEIDYSTGSIRNIVCHMMSANIRWVSRLKGETPQLYLTYEDFETLAKTKAKWDELQNQFMEYIDSLNEEQLEAKVNWEIPNREWKFDTPRWEILLHVANHGTDHRAQILAILHHHFHVKTDEQDMIIYSVEQREGNTSA